MYKRGHVRTGMAKQRKPQQRSLERLRKMGTEIEATLAKRTLTQLVQGK